MSTAKKSPKPKGIVKTKTTIGRPVASKGNKPHFTKAKPDKRSGK